MESTRSQNRTGWIAAIAFGLLVVGPLTSAALAQQPAPVPIAFDARVLADESTATRATFAAVWGGGANSRWIEEHNAALSIGAAAKRTRIGYLTDSIAAQNAQRRQDFVQRLRELGREPGRDLIIEWRYTEAQADRLPGYVSELLGMGLDALVTQGGVSARTAGGAAGKVPIVSDGVTDPVGTGLAASLEKPDGNLTGALTVQANTPRLQVLKQLFPSASKFAALWNPATPTAQSLLREAQDAPGTLGIELVPVAARTADEIPGAFDAAVAAKLDAVLVITDSLYTVNRVRMGELAIQKRLPVMAQGRPAVLEGQLMAYTLDPADSPRRTADALDRVLKGERAGDIPIVRPTGYAFVVNLKAADAIGLKFPESVLSQATEVVR